MFAHEERQLADTVDRATVEAMRAYEAVMGPSPDLAPTLAVLSALVAFRHAMHQGPLQAPRVRLMP